jgi:phosphohistidine phosphatase
LTIELYLVRHAIAAERGPKFPDDRLRPLTPEGAQKFKDAVRGLASLNIVVDLVLTSPLVRARETAAILASGLGRRPIEEIDALAPGGRHAALVEVLAYQAKKCPRLALVGHEPDLGELVMRLLAANGTVKFKKGAVCAIDVDGATPGGPGTLRWFLTPRVLRALAQ